jgi:hypothetical protein
MSNSAELRDDFSSSTLARVSDIRYSLIMTNKTTAAQDSKTSARIVAIRDSAGNPGTHCPCCTQPVAAPYRRVLEGRVAEGCVDAAHAEYADAWHDRPQARDIRARELAHLVSL